MNMPALHGLIAFVNEALDVVCFSSMGTHPILKGQKLGNIHLNLLVTMSNIEDSSV